MVLQIDGPKASTQGADGELKLLKGDRAAHSKSVNSAGCNRCQSFYQILALLQTFSGSPQPSRAVHTRVLPKGPNRTKKTTICQKKSVNHYAVVSLLRPPILLCLGPFSKWKNL